MEASIQQLIQNIDDAHVPLTLLSQYMPYQYQAVRAGKLALTSDTHASPRAFFTL